jgi:hypothetical protein
MKMARASDRMGSEYVPDLAVLILFHARFC